MQNILNNLNYLKLSYLFFKLLSNYSNKMSKYISVFFDIGELKINAKKVNSLLLNNSINLETIFKEFLQLIDQILVKKLSKKITKI